MELSLDAVRDQIALSIDSGESLAAVEAQLIEPSTVSEDERAALWLFAWSHANRLQRSPRAVELVAR